MSLYHSFFSFLLIGNILRLVVGILLYDHKVLHDIIIGQVFFSGDFSSLTEADEHRSMMLLETGDGLGLACSTHGVYSLTNLDRYFYVFKLLIECHAPSWVPWEDQVVQEVMVLSTDEGVHVSRSVEYCENSSQAYLGEQELVAVEWWEAKHSFSHVH